MSKREDFKNAKYQNVGELLKEAKERAKPKKKGLRFMIVMLNVSDKRHELRITGVISHTENYLLEYLEKGCAAARNARNEICSIGEFYLDDIAEYLDIGLNKVYSLLKGLVKKNLIIRQPTRDKGRELIGLNLEIFGPLLESRQLKKEQDRLARKLMNLPNNKPNESVQHLDQISPKVGPKKSQSRTEQIQNLDQIISQAIENKEEKNLLGLLSTFLGPSLVAGTGKDVYDTLPQTDQQRKIQDTIQRLAEQSRKKAL